MAIPGVHGDNSLTEYAKSYKTRTKANGSQEITAGQNIINGFFGTHGKTETDFKSYFGNLYDNFWGNRTADEEDAVTLNQIAYGIEEENRKIFNAVSTDKTAKSFLTSLKGATTLDNVLSYDDFNSYLDTFAGDDTGKKQAVLDAFSASNAKGLFELLRTDNRSNGGSLTSYDLKELGQMLTLADKELETKKGGAEKSVEDGLFKVAYSGGESPMDIGYLRDEFNLDRLAAKKLAIIFDQRLPGISHKGNRVNLSKFIVNSDKKDLKFGNYEALASDIDTEYKKYLSSYQNGALTPLNSGLIDDIGTLAHHKPGNKESLKSIQRVLKKHGVYRGNIDGDFGPQTYKAIFDFQKGNDLDADGQIGPKTWAKLKARYPELVLKA